MAECDFILARDFFRLINGSERIISAQISDIKCTKSGRHEPVSNKPKTLTFGHTISKCSMQIHVLVWS